MLANLSTQRRYLPLIAAVSFLVFIAVLVRQHRLNEFSGGRRIDAEALSMGSDGCAERYPGYDWEIERLLWLRDEGITEKDIDVAEEMCKKEGVKSWARVLVWNGKIYIISSSEPNSPNDSRLTTTLSSLAAAVAHSPQPLPSAEFILIADYTAPPQILAWTATRSPDATPMHQNLAMPDGEAILEHPVFGSYASVLQQIEKVNKEYIFNPAEEEEEGERKDIKEDETPKEDSTRRRKPYVSITKKTPKLLFRARKTGDKTHDSTIDTVAKALEGKDWAVVDIATSTNPVSNDDMTESTSPKPTPLLPPEEACRYAYILHHPSLNPSPYSLPLPFLFACNSVVISASPDRAPLQWYHTFLSSDFFATHIRQNYISINSDLSNLEEQLKWAMEWADDAQKIADRGRELAVGRTTEAAVACAWRRGVQVWGGFMREGGVGKVRVGEEVGGDQESYNGLRLEVGEGEEGRNRGVELKMWVKERRNN